MTLVVVDGGGVVVVVAVRGGGGGGGGRRRPLPTETTSIFGGQVADVLLCPADFNHSCAPNCAVAFIGPRCGYLAHCGRTVTAAIIKIFAVISLSSFVRSEL